MTHEGAKGCVTSGDVHVNDIDLVGFFNGQAAALFCLNIAVVAEIAFSGARVCNYGEKVNSKMGNTVGVVVHETPKCNKVKRCVLVT